MQQTNCFITRWHQWIVATLVCVLLVQISCNDRGTNPPVDEPEPPPPPASRPGCPFKHVEIDDTTRSYVFWDGTIKQLNPTYVRARFARGVTDSAALAIAGKYGLKTKTRSVFRGIRFYVFCVPEGKRAEQFFTPYGKPDIQNFGAELLVDAAFAVFENGLYGYNDEFIVQFDSTLTRAAIDSINALYRVIIDTTFVVADQLWYLLRVTKQSPYSSFDMANLYHCLPEVRDGISAAESHTFIPPMGERCVPYVPRGNSVLNNNFIERRNQQ